MKFSIQISAEIEADSIDEVFDLLSEYFVELYNGEQVQSPLPSGSISIQAEDGSEFHSA